MMPVSAAIIDAAGRLADWNAGFESEFAAVRELLLRGAGFAPVVAAAVEREGIARDGAWAPSEDGRGSFEYVSGGRTVRVESTRTADGGRMRVAAESTDTGRIAHDLNNVLMAVLANADSIASALAPDSPSARQAEAIMRAVDRGRVLTGRLSGIASRPAAAPAEAPAPRPQRAPSVLLVEDNALVRETLTASLGALGYRVWAADRGESARRILDGAEPIDVLFTDVVLPGGLGGPELARIAHAQHPGIRTLFTSGFDAAILRGDGALPPDAAFLMKPYDLDDLVAAFAALLET